MEYENLLIQLTLGVIVGLGFVAPTVRALLTTANFSSAFATVVGIVVGVAVTILFTLKGRRVR